MAMSRIEQLIEDIYEFVESCKMQPFSSTKVIVPKDELYDLLDELRLRTPDEIKRYQKIIANRDAILADAEVKGKAIVEDADNRALSMINEHEIMQQAYEQGNSLVNNATLHAEKILNEANYEANQIRSSSLIYTNELLSSVESVVSNTYAQSNRDYEELISNLKGTLDLIRENKGELSNSNGNEPEDEEADYQEENYEEDYDEDIESDDIEDDSFLQDIE